MACNRCTYCCTNLNMSYLGLIDPEKYRTEREKEFCKKLGIDDILKTNPTLNLKWKCKYLDGKNCSVHEDDQLRPTYCFEHECDKAKQGGFMELILPEKVANRIKELAMNYNFIKSQIDLIINTFVDSTNPDHSGSNWRLSDDGTKIIKMEEVK